MKYIAIPMTLIPRKYFTLTGHIRDTGYIEM